MKKENMYRGKLVELKSVSLFLNFENGDLYQIGIDGRQQGECEFNILDRDGRSYDYETFDKMLNKEDSKVVMTYLYEYIQRETRLKKLLFRLNSKE
jgi:hypothetical protein